MCKTNMKTNLYYSNICKHEHEKNMTRLWCKIVFKIGVEQTKGNKLMKKNLFKKLGRKTKRNSKKTYCFYQLGT